MTKGNEITKVFNYVQQIFRETQRIFVKLDNLMEPEWKSVWGNRITRDVTSHLQYPEKWLVQAVFRMYESDDKYVNKGVTITYWGDIQEPIITVGEISYSDLNSRNHWDLWNAWFMWESDNEEMLSDGTIYTFNPEEISYIDKVSISSFPLVSIETDKDIEEKIYSKLLY
ncbi:MAG: hypothetical protein ACOCRO_06890 [Halanaerobiales bacterium]